MLRIKRIALIGLLGLATSGLLAQDQAKIDSLFQVLRTSKQDTNKVILLYELSREFFNNDIVGSEKYANRALFVSQKLGFKRGIALSYSTLGIINYYKAIYSTALSYQERSLELMTEIGDQKGMATSHNAKGAVYTQTGDYSDAIEEYMSSLRIMQDIGNEEGLGKTFSNIGTVYYLQGNYPQANLYYKRALEIFEKLGDESQIAGILNNMGIIAYEDGAYDVSLDLHMRSLDTRKKLGNQRGESESYTNIGDVYAAQDAFEKALEYQQKALEIQEELGDKKGMLSSMKGIGTVYKLTGRSDSALNYLNGVLELSSEIGAKREVRDSYNNLSELYIEMGDYENALKYKAKYAQMKDTLFNEQTAELTSSIEAKYENEQKAKEIEILKRENQIQELELGRNRILIIASVGGLILALISIFIFARINREKRKAMELLQKQNKNIRKQKEEKEVLLKEIHHRVKNNLQVINSLIRLQCAYTEDREALELFDECQNRIISMALIHEKMYEAHDLSNINIQQYVTQLTQNLLRSYRLNQHINLDINVKIEHLSLDTLVPLGLLLNELISNTLKHAFEGRDSGEIAVHLKKNEKGLFELFVGDNGVGLKKDFSFKNSNSLGMELVATLADQLDGTIVRVERPGTYFRIEFIGLEKQRSDIEKAMKSDPHLEVA